MQKLRHLSVPHQTTLPKCSDNCDRCLPHLQTLSAITPNRETAALIIHYRFLNLIKLTLNSLDMGKTKKCLQCLYKLECLQKQKVINCAVFPIAGTFPTRLVKVTLVRTDLVADDVMRTLEKLGHLQVLRLQQDPLGGPSWK
ncbi:uncharacterized protein [Gossypium hirsutum]|uniref:Uncharacterized protein n=1 Tax=Gossypium hirsutum TaxID=3635 RepID=A0ABM3A209_GOSHI|nr:uncharacterized protein LOC121217416 [Gossypium hirsutum]